MKLCINCQFFNPNETDWPDKKYQIRYAICTRTSTVSVNDGRSCSSERKLPVIFGGCGHSARYFEAK